MRVRCIWVREENLAAAANGMNAMSQLKKSPSVTQLLFNSLWDTHALHSLQFPAKNIPYLYGYIYLHF